MAEVRIRPARPEDTPATRELLKELHDQRMVWGVFPPRPGYLDDAAKRYEASSGDPDALHVVADEDGEVVGMAFVHIEQVSSSSDELAAELSSVVVRRSHRRRGVGRALVREVARFALERGVRQVTVRVYAQNEEANRFWEDLGFQPRVAQLTVAASEL